MNQLTFPKVFPVLVFLSSFMFLISGVQKLSSVGGSDVNRLMNQLPNLFTVNTATLIILLAGLWELLASVGIIYASLDPSRRKKLGGYSALALAIFTILATLIFYVQPFKYYPVISNVDTVAGLLIIYFIFMKLF